MTLSAGVYELRFTNVGSQCAEVEWLLKIESLDWEKIFNNGVSQSSALSLMTFSSPQAASLPGAECGLLSVPPVANGADFGNSIGPMPSSLLITLTTSLAGQPSWDAQPYAAGLAVEFGTAGQALDNRDGPSFASGDTENNDGADLIHDGVIVRETEGNPGRADADILPNLSRWRLRRHARRHSRTGTNRVVDPRRLGDLRLVRTIAARCRP